MGSEMCIRDRYHFNGPRGVERFHRDTLSHSLDGILILSLVGIRGNDTGLRRSRPVTNSKYKAHSTRFETRQAYETSFVISFGAGAGSSSLRVPSSSVALNSVGDSGLT